MKLPSLARVASQTGRTVSRFPFETLATITGTIAAMIAQKVHYDNTSYYIKIVITAALGLVVFLSGSLFCERFSLSGIKKWAIQIILAGLLIGYYFTLRNEMTYSQNIRHFVLDVSFHLLVSFIAIGAGLSINAFWQFNKTLFIRILTAALYSGVLFIGLAGALLAIDNLFDVKIKGYCYLWLFSIIAGLFNTLFFLSGMPSQEKIAATDDTYPKGLKNFTQFVLLPIVSIYLLILLAYETKITATLHLPFGWVSYLILSYAIAGILSILLVYPIRNDEGHKWIRTFSKWFYVALVPLVALLYWAILYRIHKYGITEERYYVVLLAIWLTFVTVYFLVSHRQNIKLIPVTLCLLGFISTYGPLSSSFISRKSQLHRFEEYVARSKTERLTDDDQEQMSSILDYMLPNYGVKSLNSVLNHAFDSLDINGITSNDYADPIMTHLGLKYVGYRRYKPDSREKYYYLASHSLIDIRGYQYRFRTEPTEELGEDAPDRSNSIAEKISWKTDPSGISITINDQHIMINPALHYEMLRKKDLLLPYQFSSTLGPDEMTQYADQNGYHIAVVYNNFNGKMIINSDTTYKVDHFIADVFIRKKDN